MEDVDTFSRNFATWIVTNAWFQLAVTLATAFALFGYDVVSVQLRTIALVCWLRSILHAD